MPAGSLYIDGRDRVRQMYVPEPAMVSFSTRKKVDCGKLVFWVAGCVFFFFKLLKLILFVCEARPDSGN